MNHARLGKIQITREMIMGSPEYVTSIFAQINFLPIDVNKCYMYGTKAGCCVYIYEYTGYCSKFEELCYGENPPRYELTLRNIEDDICVEGVNRETA